MEQKINVYKLIDSMKDTIYRTNDNACIPIEPRNIDYVFFKIEMEKGLAELQDVTGTVMTREQCLDFISKLPN